MSKLLMLCAGMAGLWGSHIRLHKETIDKVLKITVPAHRPIKRSTLSHILKSAELTADQLKELL